MLAVAPRGRLSWIPNILGAREVPPAPLHHQEDKTAAGRTNRRKVLEEEDEEEKEGVYGVMEDSTIWFVFSGIKISSQNRTHKREREEEEERRRRSGGRNLEEKERRRKKKKCAGGNDPSVLLCCTTFNLFLFNLTWQLKRWENSLSKNNFHLEKQKNMEAERKWEKNPSRPRK